MNAVGVISCKKLLIEDLTPAAGSLTTQAIASVQAFFAEANHHPSPDMVLALTEAARVMEAMANGDCDPAIYLSSLDPGVGKTRTIIHFIQSLLASSDHQDVGVLVCVSRLQEIGSLVGAMGLVRDQFGVLTSDAGLNRLGVSPTSARVLFTTHAMVERRTEGRRFSEVKELSWNGRPRQVRIWDEAILPGETLTVGRDDIAALLKPLRAPHTALAEELDDLVSELRALEDGSRISLPDFAARHGVDVNAVLGLLQGHPQDLQRSAQALWLLSGQVVTVRKDGLYGHTMLDYRNTLPEDLAPLLVLDASGRVRTTYRHWEERRGGLVRLPSATKRYDNLTIHVWQTGGGKEAFRRKANTLVDGIASTINTKPDEQWLVVHHQTGINMDLPDQVRSLLVGDSDRVHFLGWGSHDATNEFANVSNVILAGTLFYRTSRCEALGRLVSDRPSADGEYSEDDRREIELGEHCHLILQALCRGSVRRCVGNVCAPCDAYIIASVRSGIPSMIKNIFPGCRVMPWRPVARAVGGKVAEALRFITEQLASDPGRLLRFVDVAKAIGMDRSNFRRSVRQHSDFIEALAAEGVVEEGNGFRLVAREAMDEAA